MVLLRPTGCWLRVPSVYGACSLDECTDGDERGGEVKVELDDLAGAFEAAAQLSVAVHPGMGAFDHPAFSDLDRGGYALDGDLAGKSVFVQDLGAGLAVVGGVQVD